jgi:hypothetical protein
MLEVCDENDAPSFYDQQRVMDPAVSPLVCTHR